MIDIRSLLRRSPDEYRIIRSGPNEERETIEDGLTDPPDADLYLLNHDLDPGTYRCQGIRDNRFGEVAWVREVEDHRNSRRVEELEEEIRNLRAAVESSSPSPAQPAQSFEDQLKRATFESVLDGELGVGDARQIAELSAAFEGGAEAGLADSVEDPKDLGEIAGRSVLKLLDDPSQAEKLSESAGRAASGVLKGLQVEPEQAAEQRGEPDDGDEDEAQSRLDLDPGPTTLDDLGADRGGPTTLDDVRDEAEVVEEAEEPITPEADADEAEAVADGGEPDDDEPSEEEVADAI